MFRKVWRKSEMCTHMIYVHMRESSCSPNSSTPEHDRPQYTASVSAQQYSSFTLLSPLFHSGKATFGTSIQNITICLEFIFFLIS